MERGPDEVAADIEKGIKTLDDICLKYKGAARAAAEAEVSYKVAFAKARLASRAAETDKRVTDAVANDVATVATEELNLAYEVAKAVAEAYKHKMIAVREANNNNQSLLRYLRESGA